MTYPFNEKLFKQVAKKLNKIANGRYNLIEYKISQYKNNFIKKECSLYLDGYNHFSASTWKEAFKKLDEKINPTKITINDIDPVEELTK